MLILSRKKDESIIINGDIKIRIIAIDEGRVKIGIDAPNDIEILRSEVLEKIQLENIEASKNKSSVKFLSERIKKRKDGK